MMNRNKWVLGIFMFLSATFALAQGITQEHKQQKPATQAVQIVALDECDPATFNAALGAGFLQERNSGSFHHAGPVVRPGGRRHAGSGLGFRAR